MSEVHVVIAEFGEYSDRVVWVAGVYSNVKEAESAITRATECNRVHEAWYDTYCQELRRVRNNEWFGIPTDAEEAEAKRRAGPEPPHESAERCELVTCQIDQWIKD